MTARRHPDNVIAAWLQDEAPKGAPERLLTASRDRIRSTAQRRAWGPAGTMIGRNDVARFALAAAAVMVVAGVGINLLPAGGGVGGSSPVATPIPSSSPGATPSVELAPVIGLPPEGTMPSNAEPGELVLQFEGAASGMSIWAYADGRLIWSRFHGVPADASEAFIGFSEQRLTPSGVDFLRSALISTGLFKTDLVLAREGNAPFLEIQLRNGDRLVKVTWAWRGITKDAPIATPAQESALRAVDALLTDPASWPESAWDAPAIREYVPSEYLICFGAVPRHPAPGASPGPTGPGGIWALLPEPAQGLLRIDDRTPQGSMHADLGCARVTTDDARALARIFDDAGIQRDHPEPRALWLRYTFEDPGVPGNEVWIQFGAVLPHGEAVYLGPG